MIGSSNPNGYTLIELLVTIAIAAILAAVAVPSFQEIFRSNRLSSQTSDLVAALNLARSEALRRGYRVTICKSSDGSSCTEAGDWSQGWVVFADRQDGQNGRPGATGTINAASGVYGADPILRVNGAFGSTGSTLGGGANFSNWITFLASGVSRGNGGLANGTLTLCNSSKSSVITINTAGRINVSKGAC